MRGLQTDAGVDTLERIQNGRIHLDVQDLVLHGQNRRNVEAFLLITHIYYLMDLFSYPYLHGH